MKKTLLLLTTVIIGSLNAQQISYKVTVDNPENIPKTNINFDVLNLDMNEMLSSSSLNLGVWGYQTVIPNKLSIDFDFKKSWMAFARMSKNKRTYSGHLSLSIGVNYNVLSFSKKKQIKIVLDSKKTKVEYTATTRKDTYKELSINVPGTVITKLAARSGLFFKQNAYEYTDLQGLFDFSKHGGKMTTKGGYIGMSLKKFKNLFIETKIYGAKFNSKAIEYYCDLLILPFQKFTNVVAPAGETNYTPIDETKLIEDNAKHSSLGVRFGARIYPISGYDKTEERFPLSFIFEFGSRPYIGKYMNIGLSLNLIKIN